MALTPKEIEQMAEQAKAEQVKALLEAQLDDDFKDIVSTASGRRFMWHLMAECRPFQPIFHEEASIMYLREGKRQIGLMLMNQFQSLCPEQYLQTVAENRTYDPKEKTNEPV